MTVLFFWGGFFVWPNFVLAQTADHLVISQIQVAGATADDEFIEIYNPTSSITNIENWSIQYKGGTSKSFLKKNFPTGAQVPAHGWYLIVNSKGYDDTAITPPDMFQSTFSLASSPSGAGGNIFLVNNQIFLTSANDAVIVDKLGYGVADSAENTPAFLPPDNQSIERKPGGEQGNGEDSNNNNQDFLAPAVSHPRNSQSVPQPAIESPPPSPPAPPPPLPPPAPTPNTGDIVINEFVADPVEGGKEWIEIYNKTSQSFDLTGFKIFDGSGSAIVTLSQAINGNGFLVFELSAPKLNNSGDIIILKNVDGVVIDQATYGDWDDGNLDDNAPSTEDPNSMARKSDGQDSGADNQDFALTITPTKGAANQITSPAPPAPPSAPETPSFDASDIVVNEFLPNPSEGKEWVEVYLNKSSEVDLAGWKIYDGTGNVILSLSGALTTTARFAVFDLTSDRLNNEGDILMLKAPDGSLIDSIAYGNWNDGNTLDNAPATTKSGQTIIRKSNGLDTNNDAQDFVVTDQATKNNSNVTLKTETVGGGTSVKNYVVPKAIIVINEFVSDPADNEEEWVELYNAGETSVELNGWYLEEGSKAKTELSGTLVPGQFKIVSPIKGNLNNIGDIIFFKDDHENIFDQVAYGVWEDGNVADNAPTATDPSSVARVCDGCSTKNPSKDFVVALSPTRGKSNQSENAVQVDSKANVVINELFPDPKGDDESGEFVELKNMEGRQVNLQGWYLKDASGKKYKMPSVNVPAGGLFLIKRSQSKLALNNSTETVWLYAPDDTLKDKVNMSDIKEGLSFSRFEKGWQWSGLSTPGQENILQSANHPPQIVIEAPQEAVVGQEIKLDASDSFDEDDDEIRYRWLLGDQTMSGAAISYTFNQPGEHDVHLEIDDGKEKASKIVKIAVVEKIEASTMKQLYISEIMPNPEGSDSAEWIELYYDGATPLDLGGFKIDDDEGGSRPYKIKDTTIQPQSYLVFERVVTKLALNNGGDKARLFDAAGNLVQEIKYDRAPEGLSWSRQTDGSYLWTQPTKNGANSSEAIGINLGKQPKSSQIIEVSLKDLRQEDAGERVKVRGVVSAPPGILGSQFFYIAGSGAQVYMYKKDFPGLKIGDMVEVTGELAETVGEPRIKVAKKEDIKVVKSGGPVVPKELSVADINDEASGGLATVLGLIIEARGQRLLIDDGGNELGVYVKKSTGIDVSLLKEGDKVSLTGILTKNKNGFELWPRFAEDIQILEKSALNSGTEPITGESKNVATNYLAATAGGLTSILVTLGFRNKLLKIIPFGMLTALIQWRKKKKEDNSDLTSSGS